MRRGYSLTLIVKIFFALQVALCEDKLIQVVELFRHGARGPIRNIYDSEEQLYIKGQLTDVGQHQHYQLGSQMRKEYITERKFLNETYNHTEIIIYTTNYNRTIMSAYSHLTGMYPPGTGPKLTVDSAKFLMSPYENLTYQEIEGGYALPNGINAFPIHTLPQQGSIIPDYCPNYNQLVQNNLLKYADYLVNLNQKCLPLYNELSAMLGQEFKNLHDVMVFEDVMTSDIFQERKLPNQLSEKQINQIRALRAISWFIYQSGDLAKALQSNTFSYIIDQFQNKINKNSTLKYIVLSGHDSNLSRTLSFFNISNHICLWEKYEGRQFTNIQCEDSPRFAANIHFELYESEQNPDNHYVMMRYNGKYVYLCEKQDTKCDWNEFKQRVTNDLGNYEELCGIINNSEIKNDENDKYKDEQIQTLSFVVVILIIIIAFLGYYLYRLKKGDSYGSDPNFSTNPQQFQEMEEA